MKNRRLARALGVAGVALVAVAVLDGATGHGVGLGNAEIGSVVLVGSLIAFALGAGVVAATGSVARPTRVGLTLLAIGLVLLVVSSLIGATLPYDPLENMPLVILTLSGLAATLLGAVVTIVAWSSQRAEPSRR